jgi:hypothetical protein
LGNRSNNSSLVRNFELSFFDSVSTLGINGSSLFIANGKGVSANSIRSTPVNSLANGFVGQVATQWSTGQAPTAWINGVSQTLSDWINGVNTDLQWDAVDPGLGIFNSSVAYSNSPAQCRIAEIIIANAAIQTSVRQKIEGYVAHKWGLTANLPAGHPYKTVGPTP